MADKIHYARGRDIICQDPRFPCGEYRVATATSGLQAAKLCFRLNAKQELYTAIKAGLLTAVFACMMLLMLIVAVQKGWIG